MFKYVDMRDNYEQRKVGRYELGDDILISTAYVNDGTQPYETAIFHPDYRNGNCIVVEAYSATADAKLGHDKWVAIMTLGALPDELSDCGNSHISIFIGELFDASKVYKRTPKQSTNEGGE